MLTSDDGMDGCMFRSTGDFISRHDNDIAMLMSDKDDVVLTNGNNVGIATGNLASVGCADGRFARA